MVSTVAVLIVINPFEQIAEQLGWQPNEQTRRDNVAGNTKSSDEVTPFQDVQLERAKEKAREVIDSFTEVQHEFETEQYAQKSFVEEYATIQEIAVQGDDKFKQRDFDAAIAKYETALTDLLLLQEQIDREFETAVGEAFDWLEKRQEKAAGEAFQHAGTLKPLHPLLNDGLARLEVLPQVNEHIRESERAILREEWDLARTHLDSVQKLDPLTLGLEEKRTIIREKQHEQEIRDLLSDAHQALASNEFDRARAKFTEVLGREPENTAAKTGIQQTEQSRLIYNIQTLRTEAEQAEQELDFIRALEIYEQILAIDSSLSFAVDGRKRVYEVINATRQMQAILGDPDSLSSDEQFQNAQQVLEVAEKYEGHSKQYDEILEDFSDLVKYATEPVKVTVLSDSLTEVLLIKHGPLGNFESTELHLRPGRYELVGSRDGWRDIRRTIVVKPSMEPIEISCVEQI